MIWRNGRPPPGIVVRNERLDADEVVDVDGMAVIGPARTAFDLARHLPRDAAVQHLDALGLDDDGKQHWGHLPLAGDTDRARYVHGIGRAELIEREGWIDIRVVAEHSRRFILHRVSTAFARRGYPVTLRPGS